MTLMDTLILKEVTNNTEANIAYGIAPLMYDPYKENSNFTANYFMGLAYTIAFLFPLFTLISKLMQDKASRIREKMSVMGMTDFAYFSAYFIFYVVMVMVSTFGCAFIVMWGLFKYSSYLLVVVFTLIYALAIFPWAIFIW